MIQSIYIKYALFIHHRSNPSPELPLYKRVQNTQREMNLISQERIPVDSQTTEAKKRKKLDQW